MAPEDLMISQIAQRGMINPFVAAPAVAPQSRPVQGSPVVSTRPTNTSFSGSVNANPFASVANTNGIGLAPLSDGALGEANALYVRNGRAGANLRFSA